MITLYRALERSHSAVPAFFSSVIVEMIEHFARTCLSGCLIGHLNPNIHISGNRINQDLRIPSGLRVNRKECSSTNRMMG